MTAAAKAKINWALVLMAVLSVGVAGHGLSYLVLGFAHAPPELQASTFPSPYGLVVHAGAAGAALLIGPWQFIRSLRAKRPRLHRWMGRAYVTACLIGGVSGALIAPFTAAGPIAGSGFLALGLAWLWCTTMAYAAATRRDFATHERWMVRSFALTFAAVTLRLYLPISAIAGIEFFPAYRVIAWLCWVPNLAFAELWLRARRPRRVAQPA